MPSVEVEIEVYCSCGEGLCRQTSVGNTRGRGQQYFTVEPCQKCLEAEHDKGHRKGYDEGYVDKEKEIEKKET